MSNEEASVSPLGNVQAALAERGVTAAVVIDRLIEVLDLEKDVELAKYLSVSKATVSTWRSRNKIPYDAILLAYIDKRIDIVYCLTGEKLSALSNYPAYHAGLELAGLVGELNRIYGSPDKWRLAADQLPDQKVRGAKEDGAQ